MDLIQYGESSRSPSAGAQGINGNAATNGHLPNGTHQEDIDMDPVPSSETTDLILPTWDIPPQKSLHASLDLISLLHLDTLYNTYVRPFADPIAHDDEVNNGLKDEGGDIANGLGNGVKEEKGKRKGLAKKRRLEKGYEHLLDDCIDPTPMGTNPNPQSQSLLPLIPEFSNHPVNPANYWTEAIQVLDRSKFMVAKLEVGTKVDGYSGGRKHGVDAAEEKRKKKRAQRMSQAPDDPHTTPLPFSPTLNSPHQVAPPTFPFRSSSFSTPRGNPSTPRGGRGGTPNRGSPFPFVHTPGGRGGGGGGGGFGFGTPRGTPRRGRGFGRQTAPPSHGGGGGGMSGGMGNGGYGYQASPRDGGGVGTPGLKRAIDGGLQGGTPKRNKGSRSESPLGGGGGGGSGSGSGDTAAQEGGIKRVFKPQG